MNTLTDTIKMQKPALKTVQPAFGSSFLFRRFSDDTPEGFAQWHYHPELELVYIDKGAGKRHIGNHVSYYSHGDLILIGPNLPHYGFAHRLTKNNTEMVVHFREDFLGKDFFKSEEMQKIAALIDRSKQGLTYYGKTKREIGKLLSEMDIMSRFDRLLRILKILNIMAESEEYKTMNASRFTFEVNKSDNDRIKLVYDYVRGNFQTEVKLEEVAKLTNMTAPSFCRYFKKQTKKTFTEFVNEFKVIHACKLLSETNRTIADICFECGFNNFSHFNKQFKQVTEKSPSSYRAEFKEVIG